MTDVAKMPPGFPITPRLTVGWYVKDTSTVILRVDEHEDVPLTADDAQRLVIALETLLKMQTTIALMDRLANPTR